MAESKKSNSKSDKKIVDVAQPGKTAPSSNSKSVIVNNRPIIKDPMVVDESQDSEETKVTVKTGRETTIKPLDSADKAPESKDPKPESDNEPEPPKPNKEKTIAALAEEAAVKEKETETEQKESKPTLDPAKTIEPPAETKPDIKPLDDKPVEDKPEPDSTNPADPTPKEIEEEAAAETKHDEEMQKMIDSKKYFLPINSVEKRRSKRVVIIGILLSLLLLAAWVNIALDAGILEVESVKPVTDFFPN